MTEIERKYEAAESGAAGPPALDGLPSVDRTVEQDPVLLDAVYFDTADLALAAHRTTLRRRTGGADAGWHLKLPTSQADTRTEVQAPLGRATGKPPKALRAEVAALVRGRALAPVVRLRTTRRLTLLLDTAGRPLAEIAYDEVTASSSLAPGAAADTSRPSGASGSSPTPQAAGPAWTSETSWTETEVELHAGGTGLLDAVEERLTAAGLRRSTSPSKLARALGDRLTPPPPAPPAVPGTAGETATGYLHAQLAALLALDPPVRRAEEDAVHRMRVATRRARSAFRSFRRELDRAVTDPVGAELKWLAEVLGTERDREVLAERLGRRLAELAPVRPGVAGRTAGGEAASGEAATGDAGAGPVPPGSVTDGPAAPGSGSPVQALPPRLREAAAYRPDTHAEVVAVLDGARYFALLDALEALLAAPPYLPAAEAPAGPAAEATVNRDHRRLRRRVDIALDLPPGHDRDIALHEARKAAKRARYAAEAAGPVLGAWAEAQIRQMKAVQQLLGEHQDSVMCRAAVAALRADAVAAGEDPAPYDAIDRAERDLAAEAEARLPEAWQKADRPV